MTANDVYLRVCDFLMEETGLQLGIVTDQQVLDFLTEIVSDFCNQTEMVYGLLNQVAKFGVKEYPEPDVLLSLEEVAVDEKTLEVTSANSLDEETYQWRRDGPGIPKRYFEDQQPPQSVTIWPPPLIAGLSISSDPSGFYGTLSSVTNDGNFNVAAPPDGFFGTLAIATGECYCECPGGLYGTFAAAVPSGQNVTLVGPIQPPMGRLTLLSPIQVVPPIFLDALLYGVLQRIFSDLAECRDEQRALYCQSRYQQYVLIAKAFRDEIDGEKIWEGLQ